MAKPNKSVIKSKTVWTGLATAGLGFFDVASNQAIKCEIQGLEWLPGGALLMVIGGINIVLRFFTDGKVQVKKPNTNLSRLWRK